MEKALMRARAGELRGGQSHTVEIVVFIVFAALVGAFIVGGGVEAITNVWNDAIIKVQNMLPTD